MRETEEGIFLDDYDCAVFAKVIIFLLVVALLLGILIGWKFL